MDALLDAIHIALRDGAADDERRRALDACRVLAERLEARTDAGPGVPADEPGDATSDRDATAGDATGASEPSPATAPASDQPPTSPAAAPPLHPGAVASPLDAAIAALLPVTSTSPHASPAPASGIPVTATHPFAGMSADQILDLAIARLRAALGQRDAPPPAGQPFRLTLVPVPPLPARLP